MGPGEKRRRAGRLCQLQSLKRFWNQSSNSLFVNTQKLTKIAVQTSTKKPHITYTPPPHGLVLWANLTFFWQTYGWAGNGAPSLQEGSCHGPNKQALEAHPRCNYCELASQQIEESHPQEKVLLSQFTVILGGHFRWLLSGACLGLSVAK